MLGLAEVKAAMASLAGADGAAELRTTAKDPRAGLATGPVHESACSWPPRVLAGPWKAPEDRRAPGLVDRLRKET